VHRRLAPAVARSVQADVIALLQQRADAMRVGPGWEDGVDLGPLVSAEQLGGVVGHVERAASAGARVVTAAPRLDGPGHFMRPTVVSDVAPSMAIFRDEVFGPVVTVTPFDSEDEAIALANDTRYGLAAGVWTADMSRALRAARSIRAGTVWVNAYGSIRPEVPFGGFRESGLGRELGAHALSSYTEVKSVFVQT
jgi:phenylacetaldehyde dehydrogenase